METQSPGTFRHASSNSPPMSILSAENFNLTESGRRKEVLTKMSLGAGIW